MPDPLVAAVVLAAGGSSRFGQPKQLLEWEGRPLVAHIADIAWAAGLSPVIVILGAAAERITPVLSGRPLQLLTNYRWEEGLSSSLALGISALPPEVEAAVFLQIDQPLLTPRFLQALVERWKESGRSIVVPTWQDRPGSPVLFARSHFAELARLQGDVGGRTLIADHPDAVATLPLDDPSPLDDADTPEAYTRLEAQSRRAPAKILKPIRGIICDMDGVLWKGNAPLPGLQEFFKFMDERPLRYLLVTNNSSRTPQQYVEKLAGLGVKTDIPHIRTSSMATAEFLTRTAPGGAPVYIIGGDGVQEALQQRGFTPSNGEEAHAVVVGWDCHLSWEKLATATRLIYKGARLIGTNPDRTFPTENGTVHGNGAQLAALEAATGTKALVMGKPEPELYRQSLELLELAPEEVLVVGDRADTDILGGIRLGIPTVLLLSGVTDRAALSASPVHADLICENLADLVRIWREIE